MGAGGSVLGRFFLRAGGGRGDGDGGLRRLAARAGWMRVGGRRGLGGLAGVGEGVRGS